MFAKRTQKQLPPLLGERLNVENQFFPAAVYAFNICAPHCRGALAVLSFAFYELPGRFAWVFLA
jgi:hypothetical protein